MNRCHGAVAVAAALLLLLPATATVVSCKSEPTASAVTSCAQFGVTSDGIKVPSCSGTLETQVTLFNEFGQPKSMVITCLSSSLRYTITNISYNADGSVRSYDVAVSDGQSCHYPS